jgi:hypothetical protein
LFSAKSTGYEDGKNIGQDRWVFKGFFVRRMRSSGPKSFPRHG